MEVERLPGAGPRAQTNGGTPEAPSAPTRCEPTPTLAVVPTRLEQRPLAASAATTAIGFAGEVHGMRGRTSRRRHRSPVLGVRPPALSTCYWRAKEGPSAHTCPACFAKAGTMSLSGGPSVPLSATTSVRRIRARRRPRPGGNHRPRANPPRRAVPTAGARARSGPTVPSETTSRPPASTSRRAAAGVEPFRGRKRGSSAQGPMSARARTHSGSYDTCGHPGDAEVTDPMEPAACRPGFASPEGRSVGRPEDAEIGVRVLDLDSERRLESEEDGPGAVDFNSATHVQLR